MPIPKALLINGLPYKVKEGNWEKLGPDNLIVRSRMLEFLVRADVKPVKKRNMLLFAIISEMLEHIGQDYTNKECDLFSMLLCGFLKHNDTSYWYNPQVYNMPDFVVIGTSAWDIKTGDNSTMDEGQHGLCLYDNYEIRVKENMAAEFSAYTLFHELMHAISYTANTDWYNKEVVIRPLTSMVRGFIISNNLGWITEDENL
jgi:hypothetical protein